MDLIGENVVNLMCFKTLQSEKSSWWTLILLNTLWAHAVKDMQLSRECLMQHKTTSWKSLNDEARLLTSDLSKREKISLLHVLNPQCISWEHGILFLKRLQYMNRRCVFSIKAQSVQCVLCHCRDSEVSYCMKIKVVNTEQIIKLWPLRVINQPAARQTLD